MVYQERKSQYSVGSVVEISKRGESPKDRERGYSYAILKELQYALGLRQLFLLTFINVRKSTQEKSSTLEGIGMFYSMINLQ